MSVYREQWEKIQLKIRGFLSLAKTWDDPDTDPPSDQTIAAALDLVLAWRDRHPPNSVYFLPDGNIVLEWRYPNGRIERLEIKESGHGELMTTEPGKDAEFKAVSW